MKKIFPVLQMRFLVLSLRLSIAVWVFNFCLIQLIFFVQDRIGLFLSIAEQTEFPRFDVQLADALIFGPIMEEFIFRKCIIDFLQSRFNGIVACVVSAIVFAAAHMIDLRNFSFVRIEIFSLIAHGFTGVVYAIIYLRTQRLIYPVFAHMLFNFIVLIPKNIIYIKNDSLTYYPHLLFGIVALTYLSFEIKNTFFVQRTTP